MSTIGSGPFLRWIKVKGFHTLRVRVPLTSRSAVEKRKQQSKSSFRLHNLLEAVLGEGEWMPRPDSWMQGAEHGQFRVQQDAECLR